MRPTPDSCALLLDIDGTLVDSTYHHAVAWQRAFRSKGIDIPLYRVHRSVGLGGNKLVPGLAGDDVEHRLGDRLRDEWREQYARLVDEVAPLEGAAELVHHAAGRGFQVALASSGDPEFAADAVRLLGIGDDVAALTTSDDVEGSKPEPDLLHATVAALDEVTHAVMVGDTPYDIAAAHRAGIDCVALLSGGFSEAELSEAGAVHVADLPQNLLELDWTVYSRPVKKHPSSEGART